MAKEKAIVSQDTEKALAALRESYPVEPHANRITLPRISLVSQDKTKETGTGKTKKIELVTAAGTFFTEVATEDVDPETGKKLYRKDEIGDSFEGIILYRRKQLSYYNKETETYTSSPIYDTDDEIIPIWRDKAEVARGIPADLKARAEFDGLSAKGKKISKLEDNVILYVKKLDDDKLYQLSIRGTSMYAFKKYDRTVFVPSVVTAFNSEPKENGNIKWNQMTFTVARKLDPAEVMEVAGQVSGIKSTILAEKAQYGNVKEAAPGPDAEMVRFVEEANSR